MGSERRLYALVLSFLAVQIAVYTLLTWIYR